MFGPLWRLYRRGQHEVRELIAPLVLVGDDVIDLVAGI